MVNRIEAEQSKQANLLEAIERRGGDFEPESVHSDSVYSDNSSSSSCSSSCSSTSSGSTSKNSSSSDFSTSFSSFSSDDAEKTSVKRFLSRPRNIVVLVVLALAIGVGIFVAVAQPWKSDGKGDNKSSEKSTDGKKGGNEDPSALASDSASDSASDIASDAELTPSGELESAEVQGDDATELEASNVEEQSVEPVKSEEEINVGDDATDSDTDSDGVNKEEEEKQGGQQADEQSDEEEVIDEEVIDDTTVPTAEDQEEEPKEEPKGFFVGDRVYTGDKKDKYISYYIGEVVLVHGPNDGSDAKIWVRWSDRMSNLYLMRPHQISKDFEEGRKIPMWNKPWNREHGSHSWSKVLTRKIDELDHESQDLVFLVGDRVRLTSGDSGEETFATIKKINFARKVTNADGTTQGHASAAYLVEIDGGDDSGNPVKRWVERKKLSHTSR